MPREHRVTVEDTVDMGCVCYQSSCSECGSLTERPSFTLWGAEEVAHQHAYENNQ